MSGRIDDATNYLQNFKAEGIVKRDTPSEGVTA
jgi:hypothetical protein